MAALLSQIPVGFYVPNDSGLRSMENHSVFLELMRAGVGIPKAGAPELGGGGLVAQGLGASPVLQHIWFGLSIAGPDFHGD